ncbi:MAG: response regulator, partial [Oscillospiraceae bacterium]
MKIKVLIIDNNLDNCKRIKYNMQDETTDVYYALDSTDGIQRLVTESWHLVIMSLLISEMNGTELLRRLRTLKSLPILVLSTPETQSEALEALRYGADGVMSNDDSLDMWLAQAQATLRRYLSSTQHTEPSYITVCNGNIMIDTENRRVF